MTITEYVVPIGQNARKRHYHETERRKVNRFSVQLEVFIEDRWEAVIRYDNTHGYAHIDRFFRDGRKIKTKLHLNLNEALTLADEDIK